MKKYGLTCVVCNRDWVSKRPDALTCGNKCRKAKCTSKKNRERFAKGLLDSDFVFSELTHRAVEQNGFTLARFEDTDFDECERFERQIKYNEENKIVHKFFVEGDKIIGIYCPNNLK